jgi:DNA-binding NarL/FixJ family response regulator
VVLAEDHPAMAAELQELLMEDYDVVEIVPDGAALIEAARKHLPDAIVSDIAMPGINGLAATAALLARRPEAPIILVTVQDNRAVIRKALDCGARGYVLKCDAGNELVAAVRMALEGGLYLSSSVRVALGMKRQVSPGEKTN